VKNIIICSDGTGNSTIKGRGTNVFKLFETVDLVGHRTNPDLTPQLAFYDDGVGTEDFKPLKVFAGMTGFGLSRNVKQLYKELVRVYDPGDRIYLFGFSRGAFTVRTLAGLITACGMIDASRCETARSLEQAVRNAYKAYRHRYRTEVAKLLRGDPDASITARFRKAYCLEDETTITFIGVWDTVDAVGLPFHIADVINLVFYRFKFPDRALSKLVERACQALAIDEERQSFSPLLWQETPNDGKRIEQVWFAGAHSNVGGGYPKQGMSLVPFEWIMGKAEESGLRFLGSDRASYREHVNVDDKLYDPRAGLGVFYRWKPRDIVQMCHEGSVCPKIHLSALERIARGTEDYAPGNLPHDSKVIITPTGERDKDEALSERAREVEAVLGSQPSGGASLLSRVESEIVVGHISYYLYVLVCVIVVIAASAPEGAATLIWPWRLLMNAGRLITYIATLQLSAIIGSLKHLVASPSLVASLAGGFMTSYLLALFADRRMSAVFSQFWHKVQPKLRLALKRARKASAEAERKS